MSGPRYCSTCGALLGARAVVCGECGARYQESPYDRRATDAPGAWSRAPRARSRERSVDAAGDAEDDGIELISRDSLRAPAPGATTLRTQDQYDQPMVTQPGSPPPPVGSPTSAPAPTAGPEAAWGAPGAPAGGYGPDPVPELAPPLDGCVPAPLGKRIAASLVDGVLSTLLLVPLTIGIVLVALQRAGLLGQILVGVGVALPVAVGLLVLWLVGARGVTIGKLALGLRVTAETAGGGIGLLRALGRGVVFGVFPLLMAASVALDPKRVRRGFHDRVAGSVVVDAKAGRDPFARREDDFARRDAEHYQGSGAVAVTAHENLMAQPGSAWAPDAAAPETAAPGSHAPGTSAPSAASWDVPAAAGTGWGSPDPAPAPQAPAPVPQAPAADPGGTWAPPPTAPADPWQPEAPVAAAPAVPQAQPAPPFHPAPAAEEQHDEAVDGHTRMTAAVTDDEEDLEATRVSAVVLPPRRRLRVVSDDGTTVETPQVLVVGRNPTAGDGEERFVLRDETRSVSKTHLRIDGTGDEVLVTDLGSTNGSGVLGEDGERTPLDPDSPTVLPAGAGLTIGDRTLTVERDR